MQLSGCRCVRIHRIPAKNFPENEIGTREYGEGSYTKVRGAGFGRLRRPKARLPCSRAGGVPPPSAPPPASRQLPYLRAYVRLRGINCPKTRNGPRPLVERRIRFGSMIRSHTGRKPGCKLLSVMSPAAAESEWFPPPFVQNPFGYMPAGCRFWYSMPITTAISKVSGRVI